MFPGIMGADRATFKGRAKVARHSCNLAEQRDKARSMMNCRRRWLFRRFVATDTC